MKRKWFVLIIAMVLLIIAVPAVVGASPAQIERDSVAQVDFRMDPLTQAQLDDKVAAMDAILNGKAFGRTHEVARGQYVELSRQGEDPVWTVLGEFADFSHNTIAEPDRNVDNTTLWEADFNNDYYLDILFNEGDGVNSMRQWYIENSSNRYAVYGDVTDWVQVSGDAWTYDDDRTNPSGGNAVWYFLDESVDVWYQSQLDSGKTLAEIDVYLAQFDVWDRYDWDGDGNFDEPDGYIDHMQFVHAGEAMRPAVVT